MINKDRQRVNVLKKAARVMNADGGKLKKINDRISYVLVKTGKSRDDLEQYLGIDLDNYRETHRSTAELLRDCADFLGVSVCWLVSGDGDPFPDSSSAGISNAGSIDGSAIVQGNSAGSIIVNTGGGEILTDFERELLRIYRGFCVKNQIRYLKIGHDIENESAG